MTRRIIMREAAVKRPRAPAHREIRRKAVERAKAGTSRLVFVRHFMEEAEGTKEKEK